MDLSQKIRNIPDFPIPGIQFKDITPLLQDAKAFAETIDQLAKRYEGKGITQIVGVESRGFIFGGALANRLGAGFVPVRKRGKLPAETFQETYDLEYGSATVEMHKDALTKSDRVLILDDLLATGGTLAAACRLVDKFGAQVVEIATIIELSFLKGRDKLGGRPYFTLIRF